MYALVRGAVLLVLFYLVRTRDQIAGDPQARLQLGGEVWILDNCVAVSLASASQ